MDARKQFLAELAETSRQSWLAIGKQFYAAETHLETTNTVYRFLDGICFTVTKKTGARSRGAEGLRLIGFLVEDARGNFTLSLHPRRGAAAVLWRPQLSGATAFALTSASVVLARSHRDERAAAKAAFSVSAERRIDPQSVARVFAGPALATAS